MNDFDNSVDEEIKGKPVNPNTLDAAIINILQVYGSLYNINELTSSEIHQADLRAENIICVRQFKKGRWQHDIYPTSLSGLRGFLVSRSSGSGGGTNDDLNSISGLSDMEKLIIDLANKNAAMAAYFNGEKPLEPYRPYTVGFVQDDKPSVLITIPKKAAVITRGLRGIAIEGSTLNANNVELTWTGDNVGSESLSSRWDKWDGILPVKAGDYKLTATVSGGINHSVLFSVILKPAITAYTAEDIELINTFRWGDYNKSPEALLVHNLAIDAGLVDKKDDFTDTAMGAKVTDKVKAFTNKASGDFNLFYSGSGDKAFIDKKVTTIFGTHLSDKTRTTLIGKLKAKKTVGFIDATSEFHEAMNNSLTIFFADNSVGKMISQFDTPLAVNPAMTLVMDAAKTLVNVKLNIELALESNGAPLVMRQEAKKNVFDMVAIEVVGMAAGGVVLKVGRKAFKATKSFTTKYEFKFKKNLNQNPVTRLPRENGAWKGESGNGKWYSDKKDVIEITKGKPVVFKNGRPDFSPWQAGKPMKFKKGELDGTKKDFSIMYERIAKAKGFKNKTQAEKYIKHELKLTPHHLDNKTIQFIPTKLHGNIPHVGSASDMRGGY